MSFLRTFVICFLFRVLNAYLFNSIDSTDGRELASIGVNLSASTFSFESSGIQPFPSEVLSKDFCWYSHSRASSNDVFLAVLKVVSVPMIFQKQMREHEVKNSEKKTIEQTDKEKLTRGRQKRKHQAGIAPGT